MKVNKYLHQDIWSITILVEIAMFGPNAILHILKFGSKLNNAEKK